jgi:HEPN domain-containing protein
MNEAYRKITQEWLSKAQSDYLFAEASLREFSGFYSQICILCHDVVEKYLKAFLISQGKRPDRIHDLLAILIECRQIDPTLDVVLTQCAILNDYYIPLKYPSHYPEMTQDQAEEAFSAACAVRGEVEKRLGNNHQGAA